jgi:hypothetical protein
MGVIGLVDEHQSHDDKEGGQNKPSHAWAFAKYYGGILESPAQNAHARLRSGGHQCAIMAWRVEA